MKKRITGALREGDYKLSVKVFHAAAEEWPTDVSFQMAIPMESLEGGEEDEDEKKRKEVIRCIRNIFFGENFISIV